MELRDIKGNIINMMIVCRISGELGEEWMLEHLDHEGTIFKVLLQTSGGYK